MPESISVVFTITRDEYIRATRRYYKTKLQPKRDAIGGIIAIIAGLYLLLVADRPAVAWFLIISGGVLLALVNYVVQFLPHAIYRYHSRLKSEYRLKFRDDGLRFSTDEIESQLQWSLYHSWLRDDEFYILYYGERDIFVIPRRALLNQDDERLAELLGRSIGPAV